MTHFLISLITTSLLIGLDFFLRGELIRDNIADYSVVCLLLFALIYFSRLILDLIKNYYFKNSVAVFFALFLSLIYWLQSAVYTVYFQFISAADIGIVFSNLGYWQKGADSLISLINIEWLIAYVLIFSFAFITPKEIRLINIPLSRSVRISGLALLVSLVFGSLIHVKQNQLYFLTTPALSLAYEARKFYSEKDRFLIKVHKNNQKDFYTRNTDTIPAFKRRGDFNVLFLVLESLRYDHMSLYDYHRDTTPFQKKRFKGSFHFPNAISNATSTDTSIETIFTGLDRANSAIHKTSILWSYIKAAKINQFYVGSHWLQWNGWFGRSFLSEDVNSIQAPLAVDASLTGQDMTTTRKFKSTLADFAAKDQPFFGVVHFAGTHYPYVSPGQYYKWTPASHEFEPTRLNEIINKYDNAILYNDAAIEVVINELERLNIDDNTIIVVTADHAEAMYEHKQFFHGKVFWQEGIHVPIYIDIPEPLQKYFSPEELANLKENADYFVSIIDLFPTILDMYNIPLAKMTDGFSLLKPYPKSFIKVFVIPDEFAIIDSHSGEKFHVDNSKKVIRYTQLRNDPNEQNFSEARIDRFYSIHEIIEQAKSKTILENYSLNL